VWLPNKAHQQSKKSAPLLRSLRPFFCLGFRV